MSDIALYIGNKNYSSWSMRPWVMLKNAGIDFREVVVRFDSFAADSQFKTIINSIGPTGQVPVLIHNGLAVWDTLAIVEYAADQLGSKEIWPIDPSARARARSLCAEMHSGFRALRSACPMNIEAHLPDVGALALRDQPAVRNDVARIHSIFKEQLRLSDGPYLFGKKPTAIDAYYSPVCMRIQTYELSKDVQVLEYIQALKSSVGVSQWIELALKENDFLDFEEPYRLRP